MQQPKAILVTGSHRSGSTWAGQSLCRAPGTAYIHEPLNPSIAINPLEYDPQFWFEYISDINQHNAVKAFDRLMKFDYPIRYNLSKARTLKSIAKIARDSARFELYRMRKHTPIIKDPIALFSAPWLAQSYDMNVLVMIRHPAAFVASLKVKNWTFDFQNFLRQPLLVERYLQELEGELEIFTKSDKDIIDQAVLLWNCFHTVIREFKTDHPEWLFVRHEDLSTNPFEEFKAIYQKLNLQFTDSVETQIRQSSTSSNPVEPTGKNEFVRDSKTNILNWKNRLTDEEINRVREGTANIARHFYTSEEWG